MFEGRHDSLLPTNYWPAFTDLMSSLLLLFIFLAFFQFFSRFDFLEGLVVKAKQGFLVEEFSREFANEINDSLIKITTDGNIQRIYFSDKLLFNSGEVSLKDKQYLRRAGKILKSMGYGIFRKIQVEGYTDNVKIPLNYSLYQQGIRNNWDLSTARAVKVVQQLQDDIGIDPKLLSASGYSYYQSISNNTPDERARNRKIEIVLIYSTNDQSVADLGLDHNEN